MKKIFFLLLIFLLTACTPKEVRKYYQVIDNTVKIQLIRRDKTIYTFTDEEREDYKEILKRSIQPKVLEGNTLKKAPKIFLYDKDNTEIGLLTIDHDQMMVYFEGKENNNLNFGLTYGISMYLSESIGNRVSKIDHLKENTSLWDKKHSDIKLKTRTVDRVNFPKEISFTGKMLQALEWKDAKGKNILIHSVLQKNKDTKALYASLFQQNEKTQTFQKQWQIFDENHCPNLDSHTAFVPNATTITDVNQDGVAEISVPYIILCRGGMDPAILKIISYEGEEKYALRGETQIRCAHKNTYGGSFTPSNNLENKPRLLAFLQKHWNRLKCESNYKF